jgi:hypothetical protein
MALRVYDAKILQGVAWRNRVRRDRQLRGETGRLNGEGLYGDLNGEVGSVSIVEVL